MVGTGTMATGIVEVFAKSGYDVVYVGRSQDKVDGVPATIERSLDKAIQRGRLEESAKADVLGPTHRVHLPRRPRRPRTSWSRRSPRT